MVWKSSRSSHCRPYNRKESEKKKLEFLSSIDYQKDWVSAKEQKSREKTETPTWKFVQDKKRVEISQLKPGTNTHPFSQTVRIRATKTKQNEDREDRFRLSYRPMLLLTTAPTPSCWGLARNFLATMRGSLISQETSASVIFFSRFSSTLRYKCVPYSCSCSWSNLFVVKQKLETFGGIYREELKRERERRWL